MLELVVLKMYAIIKTIVSIGCHVHLLLTDTEKWSLKTLKHRSIIPRKSWHRFLSVFPEIHQKTSVFFVNLCLSFNFLKRATPHVSVMPRVPWYSSQSSQTGVFFVFIYYLCIYFLLKVPNFITWCRLPKGILFPKSFWCLAGLKGSKLLIYGAIQKWRQQRRREEGVHATSEIAIKINYVYKFLFFAWFWSMWQHSKLWLAFQFGFVTSIDLSKHVQAK